MARKLALQIQNKFSRGLITQATGLNFPKDAVTDADNCVFHELGHVERRNGFDFESQYQTKTIDRTAAAVNSFSWKNATGDGSVDLVVLQVGGTIYFYRPTNSSVGDATYSAGALSTTVTLSSFTPGGAPTPNLVECQFAAGVGYLIVTHPQLKPFYITFDGTTNTATATAVNMQVRDTDGIAEAVAIDNRPTTLTDNHNYNIRNQGWYVSTYIADFHTAKSAYPSNADVWWIYKNLSDAFDVTTISTLRETGTAQAPRGHFILDPFNLDRATASGVGAISSVTSAGNRPATCAFYSGRAWYAGTNYSGFESKIYFSQIVDNVSQLGLCYQAADPTSEKTNELVATDGGVLLIPGAGLIYKLQPVDNALLVFAANGIWSITGSQGIGFTALDYSVNFLSSVKTVSASSFLLVDGYPCWWAMDGINILLPTGSGGLGVKSLTDTTIKQYFMDIPLACKRVVKGAYDTRKHVVQWLFRSTAPASTNESYEFDRVLNFNTLSSAFYPWSVSDSNVKINGIFLSEGLGSVPSLLQVVQGALTVQDVGVNVGETSFSTLLLDSKNKFIVSYPNSGSYKFTFADNGNEEFLDWFTYDTVGVDSPAYFVTGFAIDGDGNRKFQNNYLHIFSDVSALDTTEYFVQGIWNFANTGNSGKYTSRQHVSITSGNFDIVRNRLKIRGQGFAAQLKFTSNTGQPFKIIGWAIEESSNAR